MGEYIVNGEVVDVRSNKPTALDLKLANQSVETDWVMASMPGGKVQKLDDTDYLPGEANEYAVITPHRYGMTA